MRDYPRASRNRVKQCELVGRRRLPEAERALEIGFCDLKVTWYEGSVSICNPLPDLLEIWFGHEEDYLRS